MKEIKQARKQSSENIKDGIKYKWEEEKKVKQKERKKERKKEKERGDDSTCSSSPCIRNPHIENTSHAQILSPQVYRMILGEYTRYCLYG